MKKTTVTGSFRNGGDGSVSMRWFLTADHAEKDQENTEGWGEPCTETVETYEGSNIHKEAVKNSKEFEGKHEYLQSEDYYESRSVGTKALSSKTCEHCGKNIPKGEPHEVHHFYPEFAAYPTHKKCVKNFMKSLN